MDALALGNGGGEAARGSHHRFFSRESEWQDEAFGGGQNAGAAAFGAAEGGGKRFPLGVHDGNGVDDEVVVGVASCAPGPVAPGLVGIPGQVCADGRVHVD